jgi:hypothetical protein
MFPVFFVLLSIVVIPHSECIDVQATCILTKKRKNWHGIPASCGIQMDAEEGIVESAAIGAAIKRAVASVCFSLSHFACS